MIRIEIFTYTDAQWSAIRAQVLDDLGVDLDQITYQVTHFDRTGTLLLRDRIETTVNQYPLHSAVNRHSPRRDELETLRTNAKSMHASIINALSVQFTAGRYGIVEPMLFNGVDADMLDATNDYFRMLAANLDRRVKQARRREDNSRKPARDKCWKELRAIWCELGGEPLGDAAAEFLKLTCLPVMNSAVPDRKSIVKWLLRHP